VELLASLYPYLLKINPVLAGGVYGADTAIIACLPNEPPPCNRAFTTSSTPPRRS